MEHFANFGVVKQANKQLRRLNELSIASKRDGGVLSWGEGDSLGNVANLLAGQKRAVTTPALKNHVENGVIPYAKKDIKEKQRDYRYLKNIESDPLKTNYINEGVSYKIPSTSPNFTDIRKTDDLAASTTGYLGFRTDPHKGYGGMMEEAIPPEDLLLKKNWKRGEYLKQKYIR